MSTFVFVDSVNTYTTNEYLPDVDKPMEMRGQVIPLLSGGTFMTAQADGNNNVVIPSIITLRWPQQAPVELIGYFEEAFIVNREITVSFPWRSSNGEITGRIIPNGYRSEQRRGGLYNLEVTIQQVSV